MQIFGQPRIRGRCVYSEALNKDGHEYDKGDAHQENRPPEKRKKNIFSLHFVFNEA